MSTAVGITNAYDRTQQTGGAGLTGRRPSQHGLEGNYDMATSKATHRSSSHSSTTVPVLQDGKSEIEESSSDDDRAIQSLARQMTQHSTYSQIDKNPFEVEPGSSIDPNSDNFRPKAWAKAMFNLSQQEGDKFLGRTAAVAFRNLSAYGFGGGMDYQMDVGNAPLKALGGLRAMIGGAKRRIDILQNLDGLLLAGEMLVVLGPPGAGCSTFLKTIAGETHGFSVGKDSYVNYQGIGYEKMHKNFKGEAIYTAEQDVHFPSMTVGDTLLFAARARAPKHIPGGVSKHTYAEHMRDMIMATFGIRHTINTKVGNDFVRGVSGGERKRVSIAEAALSGAPLQLWDNSTRGLDSANAIEFCKTLRVSSDVSGATAAVAIYQAPQSAYDIFDKALVLYEGRQIYFGPTTTAKQYFINMGFECPDRQTDADFLTSMTSSEERVVRQGYEHRVPRSPDEFAACWKNSAERKSLLEDIAQFENDHPLGGNDLELFKQSRRLQQAKRQRAGSPYTLSYGQQIKLCLWRGFARLKADPSLTFTQLFGNIIMGLIVSSVFYNLDQTTNSFFSRGALIFFAILLNAFGSALEILTLYAQRPIVEKHDRYALYHPSAEAFASMLTDLPYKVLNAILFNITLYFMTNLRREPGAFFFFLLISFFLTLVMSMLFRTIASVSRSLTQALTPAAILILAIVIYTGFAIPVNYMLGWARWINYVNPVAYGFEALMINEFSGREFDCATFVPPYGPMANRICSTVGAVAGQMTVDGTTYLESSFEYTPDHKWRNFGILWVFLIGLMTVYLVAAELVQSKKSKGEVLVFQRGHTPAVLTKTTPDDAEAAGAGHAVPVEKQSSRVNAADVIQKQTAIFQWHNVCYDIKIKSETRRILDHVDGWVKPGTLTALMGVSGAGKTTLLDVLATRVTMGVISGEMLVDGLQRDSSFQRKTGYVQQQDLHLETSTVREALNFSAVLRQPAHVPHKEKIAYVNEIIKLLDMEEYADAIVGVPGEGLNVEQRKRLTIGVELAAKPQLLLFLDEPTSGLDSQTSWSILNLLEKLKNNGQAILCTIHQPSAMLFQRFDRLLFLAKGGRTVYFGDVGQSSKTLTRYFERNGAPKCPPNANPAEWMLNVIGAAPGSHSEIDWHQVWRDSPEIAQVHREIRDMKRERAHLTRTRSKTTTKAEYREFAAPMTVQLYETTYRVFQQYWRTPSYIFSKTALVALTGLFIGFSFFKAPNTQQGLQNQLFGLFMLFTIFGQLVQQIMPLFVSQRALYEVRERPSKAYSWVAFMASNILVELPWSIFCAVLLFVTWYYPFGLYANAAYTNAVHERGAIMFLYIVEFLLFASTFAHMVIAGVATAETGGNIANLLFSLALIFCGVLASPAALPGFWIFMYRLSPFTYLVEGMLSAAVAYAPVNCADNEYLKFTAPAGETCATYMQPYITGAGTGYLQDPASSSCSFCQISTTNSFLGAVSLNPANMWRDFGIMFVFIIFNMFAAVFLYWLVRMPKSKGQSKTETGAVESEEEREEDMARAEMAMEDEEEQRDIEKGDLEKGVMAKEIGHEPCSDTDAAMTEKRLENNSQHHVAAMDKEVLGSNGGDAGGAHRLYHDAVTKKTQS